jgi:hypothetical protein
VYSKKEYSRTLLICWHGFLAITFNLRSGLIALALTSNVLRLGAKQLRYVNMQLNGDSDDVQEWIL